MSAHTCDSGTEFCQQCYCVLFMCTIVLQAFRESAMPEASELLQQLADAKTEEDKEAIKAAVVNPLVSIKINYSDW